jgi:putative membrane-bound dehydrogenase-like protein
MPTLESNPRREASLSGGFTLAVLFCKVSAGKAERSKMNQLSDFMRNSRYQFGLRSLLLLMTVFAIGSALFGWRVKYVEQLEHGVNAFNVAMDRRNYEEALLIARHTHELAPREMATGFMIDKAELALKISRGGGDAGVRGFICLSPDLSDAPLDFITVPVGFKVELAASSPLVSHPIMAGFDERGRLFVAENAGQNLKREDLEKELPNSIVLLTDTDDDGMFDKRSVFADKLTFPQGALWHDGWLYVASSGAIWRFKDTNNDDVADLREQIVSKFGYTGNAADVHGCFLGPEGRIYWCEGRHGHEITNAAGEVISKGKAARIFSCNPDGSDVQTHCGGGMDNPTEIDFTATGEMLGTVNILYAKRGDCLVHWLHGGVYPRADQPAVLAEFRRTGELLDAVHDFGHVAVSGLCRYRPYGSTKQHGFGPSFNDLWFVTEFNTHKLKQVQLTREGSTFRADVKDFLTSTSNDFHPTDVLQDADGSLLVIDTGGWFRIGCPTSQIAKPEVPGAIYRIRRQVEKKIADPWGKKIAWDRATAEELIELLADQRFAVRARAVAQLVRNKDAAVPYLAKAIHDENATRRLQAVEVLIKIGTEKVVAVLLDAAESDDSQVQQLAAFGLGSLREPSAVDCLTSLLAADEPAEVQLAATTALGQIGEAAAVPDILAAIARKPDRSREHALIYALIEIDNPAETRQAFKQQSPLVKRAGLIALDQMTSSDLRREEVAELLSSGDLALQTAALDVLSRRPGWTEELVASVSKLLEQPQLDDSQQALVISALVAFAEQTSVQQLIATKLNDEKLKPDVQRLLLEAIAQSQLPTIPTAIRPGLLNSLKSTESSTVLAAIAAATPPRDFAEQLHTVANDQQRASDVRLAALAAVSNRMPLATKNFDWLESQLASETPPALRIVAARALGSAGLTRGQQTALCKQVAAVGPLEIVPLLAAFDRPGDEYLGQQLAAALLASPGSAALNLPQLESLAKHYPAATAIALQPIFDRLHEATREQRTRLELLSSTLPTGSPTAGKQVFANRQAGCYLCHRIGNEGGRVGPDLSTIGQRRNQRDLLEAVIFPSSSLARGYESHALLLTDGRALTGLITRETADSIVLRGSDQNEIRIRRDHVEEMKPSPLSIMPAGLENALSKQQLADLIAYLQTLK